LELPLSADNRAGLGAPKATVDDSGGVEIAAARKVLFPLRMAPN